MRINKKQIKIDQMKWDKTQKLEYSKFLYVNGVHSKICSELLELDENEIIDVLKNNDLFDKKYCTICKTLKKNLIFTKILDQTENSLVIVKPVDAKPFLKIIKLIEI